MENIKICEICGFQTENGKIMSNHKRWTHITPKGSKRYEAFQEKMSKEKVKRLNLKIICSECGNAFEITVTETALKKGEYRHFCSKTCANKQGSKYVDYSKVSDWAKKNPRGYCSTQWKLTHFGSPKSFSKRELEIVSYFKKNFPNDDWKQGLICGGKKYDGCFLSPDLWSKKLKVVIEYDGIWHFKDIYNQLERKQKVDRALTKFCLENGYRLIRIDEDLYISDEDIQKAVYESSEKLELFGSKRYDYLFEKC